MSLKFQEFINPDFVPVARNLIDPCAFRTVVDYYFNSETEIEQVLIVDRELSLAEVASFFLDPLRGEDFARACNELICTGKIRFAFPEKRKSPTGVEQYAFDEIGFRRKVYVVQAAPFYLVQLTGEFWG